MLCTVDKEQEHLIKYKVGDTASGCAVPSARFNTVCIIKHIPYFTDELREAGSFNYAMEKLKSEMDKLQMELKNSVPFFSSRYKV